MNDRNYQIGPPPKDSDRLFRVVYVIDVNANNPMEAAISVHKIMMDPNSMRPVLDVIDDSGNFCRIDLSTRTLQPGIN